METKAEREEYRKKYAGINFREHPEKYRFGRGEEGVLLTQPYSSEIIKIWRFKTPKEAEESAKKIYSVFLNYLRKKDAVGASVALKFLNMGFTRAMRYANHSSGKKYVGPVPDDKKGISGAHGRPESPKDYDSEKKKSAEIFKIYWDKARENGAYQKLMEEHKEKYEQ